MNCYECGTHGCVEPAVATCVNCGAGVCATHIRIEEKRMDRIGVGNPVRISARELVCVTCDPVLAHRGPNAVA